MPRFVIYPYKMYSQSARALRDALGGIMVYPDRRYRPRDNDIIINWGNAHTPNWHPLADENYLNKVGYVEQASNKLFALESLDAFDIPIPDFTTDKYDVLDYPSVYARTILRGHGGEGIYYYDGEDVNEDMVDAPLYVKGLAIKSEYRVHIFNGQVIDYIKKRRREGDIATQEESLVRCHDNGWIFTRQNLRRLPRIEELALRAVEALQLDFGAVDIVRDNHNDCFVLEVNTAPALIGTTLSSYVNAIQDYAATTI